MDPIVTLKLFNIILVVFLILCAHKSLKKLKHKVYFDIMLICYLTSTILFFLEGTRNEWLKHLPFYTGQIFFYLFLSALLAKKYRFEKTLKTRVSLLPLFFIVANNPPKDIQTHADITNGWLEFVTTQGLQHMLTLPFFVLIASTVRVYSREIPRKLRPIGNYFLLAGLALTMIHIGEFLVESHGLFPKLNGDPIEVIEIGWFWVASGLLFVALNKLKKLNKAK